MSFFYANFMKKQSEKYLIIINIINIVLIAMFVSYRYKAELHAQLDEWKLVPKQERFTELYFDDHVNLPKQIQKGEKISFSFVIHNLEGKKWDYPYAIFFISQNGQVTKIEEKTVTLSNGEFKTIEESYISNLAENNGGIHVALQQPQQEIHFLLNNND